MEQQRREGRPRPNNNNNTWTDEATQILISIWGSTAIQDGLDGTRRNNSVYKEIATKMGEMGYTFIHQQIVCKCKNLRKKYTQEKDSNAKSGNAPTEWPYFESMDAVFGDRPISCPLHIVDTSAELDNTLLTNTSADSTEAELIDVIDVPASVSAESLAAQGTSASFVDKDLWSNSGETTAKGKRSSSPVTRGKKKNKAETLVSGINKTLADSNRQFEESFFKQQQMLMQEQFKLEEELQERKDQRAHQQQMEMFTLLGSIITQSTSQQPRPTPRSSSPSSSLMHMHPSHYDNTQSFPTSSPITPSPHVNRSLPFSMPSWHHQPQSQSTALPVAPNSAQPQSQSRAMPAASNSCTQSRHLLTALQVAPNSAQLQNQSTALPVAPNSTQPQSQSRAMPAASNSCTQSRRLLTALQVAPNSAQPQNQSRAMPVASNSCTQSRRLLTALQAAPNSAQPRNQSRAMPAASNICTQSRLLTALQTAPNSAQPQNQSRALPVAPNSTQPRNQSRALPVAPNSSTQSRRPLTAIQVPPNRPKPTTNGDREIFKPWQSL